MTSHWGLGTIIEVGCGMILAELGGIGAIVISVELVGVEIAMISIESVMLSAELGRGEVGMGEGTGVDWLGAVGKEKVRAVEDMIG